MGPGSRLGAALASSPDVDAISFTGSQDVGPSVAAAAVRHGARVQLEMGGKNPLIVLDDADLPTAVSVAVNGAFFQAGQRCTASSRLIVTEGIHDRFVAAMVDRMKRLVIDDALKPGTEIGPVVDDRQLKKNLEYLEIGRREGAQLAWGGDRLSARHRGVLPGARDVHGKHARHADQHRGDLRSGGRRDPRDAITTRRSPSPTTRRTDCRPASSRRRSSTRATSSGTRRAGLVMVNLPTAGLDYHVPFGGRKKSSYGPREQGTYAKEFYTRASRRRSGASSRSASYRGPCSSSRWISPSGTGRRRSERRQAWPSLRRPRRVARAIMRAGRESRERRSATGEWPLAVKAQRASTQRRPGGADPVAAMSTKTASIASMPACRCGERDLRSARRSVRLRPPSAPRRARR